MNSKVARKPIATWWEVDDYSPKIERVQIVAFTQKTYTFLESRGDWEPRECRRDRHPRIFTHFEAAKKFAVKRCKSNIKANREELRLEQSYLPKWKALKKPKG